MHHSTDELALLASGTLVRARDLPGISVQDAASRRTLFYRPADLQRLIQACSRHISANPTNVRARLIRGSSFFKKGAFCQALLCAVFQTSVGCEGWRPTGPHSLFAAAGDLASALGDYAQALLLDPDNTEALFQRGSVLEQLGALDRAICDFDKVLRTDPVDAKAYLRRGSCYNLRGDFDKANGMPCG